jgi:hypothetical protein
VKSALDRYATHSGIDAELAQRVHELSPDVNCWSLLAMPGRMMTTHLLPGVLDEPAASLMQQSTRLSLSVHYGSKERVDFALGMKDAATANALADAIRVPAHLLPASVAEPTHARLENVSVGGAEVRGSVRVAGKEFDPWLAEMYERAQTAGREENVAQVARGR